MSSFLELLLGSITYRNFQHFLLVVVSILFVFTTYICFFYLLFLSTTGVHTSPALPFTLILPLPSTHP